MFDLLAKAALTKYPKLDGLNLTQFRWLGVQDQGVVRLIPSEGREGESVPCLSPRFLMSLTFPGLENHHLSSAFIFTWRSACVRLCPNSFFFFFSKTPVMLD